jgi:hypothetical protein
MNYIDPYHQIGLRRNPFIAPETLEISPHRWLDMGFSFPPSPQPKLFVQIIGKKGAGKTSHLLHWKQQIGGIYYYCQADWQRWQFPPLSQVVYWDEADRIPLPILLISLGKMSYLQGTIMVGTHHNLSPLAYRFGFQVKTIHLSTLTVSYLLQWAQESLEAERLSPDIPIKVNLTTSHARKIMAQSQGSWRIAANYLHIWLAKASQS